MRIDVYRLAVIAFAVLACGLGWWWQYQKYLAGRGIFHYLSPDHGDILLHGVFAATTIVLVFAIVVDLKRLDRA